MPSKDETNIPFCWLLTNLIVSICAKEGNEIEIFEVESVFLLIMIFLKLKQETFYTIKNFLVKGMVEKVFSDNIMICSLRRVCFGPFQFSHLILGFNLQHKQNSLKQNHNFPLQSFESPQSFLVFSRLNFPEISWISSHWILFVFMRFNVSLEMKSTKLLMVFGINRNTRANDF